MDFRQHLEAIESKKEGLERLKTLLATYEEQIAIPANAEPITQELLENQRYFYAIIARKIWTALRPSSKQFLDNHKYGTVLDVFSEALELLQEKYLSTGRIASYGDAKRVLARICWTKTMRFIEKKIDDDFYASVKGVDRATKSILRPPSYYYHQDYMKNWMAENKEDYNARRRAKYAKLKMKS